MVHQQENSDSKLQFIRGFAVQDGNIQFNSGAFNRIDLNFKDSKYRALSSSEQKFLVFCLNQYWKHNKKTSFCFDEFLEQGQRSGVIMMKHAAKKDAIKPEKKQFQTWSLDIKWIHMYQWNQINLN